MVKRHTTWRRPPGGGETEPRWLDAGARLLGPALAALVTHALKFFFPWW